MATTTKKTTLDSDVTKPSVTQPGDGPADTTDPHERATTIQGGVPGPEALKAGTVNSVLPLDPIEDAPRVENPRIEEYDVVAPDGTLMHVKRNMETGESRATKATSTDTGSTATQSARS
jgi:hypothetical protein